MSTSVRSKCFGNRARLIFSVMVVTVLSALVLVGCGKDDDTPPDDVVIDGGGDDNGTDGGGGGGSGGLVGDWSMVSVEYDGEVYQIPDDDKWFFSFKASGDFVSTNFEKFGNFWIESVESEQKYTVKNNSVCFGYEYDGEEEEDCMNYSISGNTLTVNETYEYCDYDNGDGVEKCYQRISTTKAVKGNIATTRSSLGNSLKSQDPALNRTEWRQLESEYEWDRIEFWGSSYYDSRDVYISDSYDRTWYTEGGNRLILVSVECDRWEEYEHEDHYDTECVATSIETTVALEYQLTGGKLRLRPVGSNAEWDEWMPYDNYMYKSKAKSKKDRRHVNPFKVFRK
jgi:hypothetical protein